MPPEESQTLPVQEAFRRGLTDLQAGRLEEAERIFKAILAELPEHAPSLHYLGTMRHRRGLTEEALKLIRRSIELEPENPAFLQNLGGLLRAEERHAEALPHLRSAVRLAPEDAVSLANLCHVLHKTGNTEEALRIGQKALEIKDAQAMKEADARPLAPRPAPAFKTGERRRNIIAFSLWGEDAYYRAGALLNARIAPHIYPEWMCRFYCDSSVPRSFIEELLGHGAEVIQFPDLQGATTGAFWRFFAANDTKADRFLCRDCDSSLNVRERVAVEEWIASGILFHVMRDNVIHTDLILAGMWGGVTGLLPDMRAQALDYVKTRSDKWSDQGFLRHRVWPLIKEVSLTHDSHYALGQWKRFPKFGTLPPPAHVGGSLPRPES